MQKQPAKNSHASFPPSAFGGEEGSFSAHADLSVCFEHAVSHFPRVQKRRPDQDLPKPDSRLMS